LCGDIGWRGFLIDLQEAWTDLSSTHVLLRLLQLETTLETLVCSD
jgi:hypothetical protein